MEGMWTSFMPYMQAIRQHLKLGHIGTPLMVQASLGFRGGDDPSRLLNPQLAGGSSFDVGVYPLAVAIGCLTACLKTSRPAPTSAPPVSTSRWRLFVNSPRRFSRSRCSCAHTNRDELPRFRQPRQHYRARSLLARAKPSRETADGVSHEDHSFEATGFEYEARQWAMPGTGPNGMPSTYPPRQQKFSHHCRYHSAKNKFVYPFE